MTCVHAGLTTRAVRELIWTSSPHWTQHFGLYQPSRSQWTQCVTCVSTWTVCWACVRTLAKFPQLRQLRYVVSKSTMQRLFSSLVLARIDYSSSWSASCYARTPESSHECCSASSGGPGCAWPCNASNAWITLAAGYFPSAIQTVSHGSLLS